MNKSEINITGAIDGKRQNVRFQPALPIDPEEAETLRQLLIAGADCVFDLPDTTMTVSIGPPGRKNNQTFDVALKRQIKVTIESAVVTTDI